tara:strand:+ start:401 stop:1210 length:810 start_codon:yes stop_codon:yes gene_type:complete
MKKKLRDFANIHMGQRIFIFGTGPTLNDVTQEQLDYIQKNEISIGVNYTPIHVTPTYWIGGGHPTLIAFAIEHLKNETQGIFHHDPGTRDKYPKSDKVVFTEDKVCSTQSNPIPKNKKTDVIVGGHNILLSASHLAYIMGASEIIYIGFEQVNRLHFYNLWSDDKQQDFKNLLLDLSDKYSHNQSIVECIGEVLNLNEPDEQRWCHFKSVEVCKNLSFKPEGKKHHNYSMFEKYVEQFKSIGVKMKTTATEGICVHAGAEVIDLRDILK